MSWGYKIIIILTIFVAGMLFMVRLSMRQTHEMVDADYYERELQYQQIIDAKKNLSDVGNTIELIKDSTLVRVVFPEATVSQLDSGIIEFVRLSDSREDRTIIMEAGKDGVYRIPLATFSRGWYNVRITWRNQGIPYYREQNTYIP